MLLFYLITALLVPVCLLLIAAVMLQQSKEQAGAEVMGSAAMQQVVGTAQLTSVMEQITYGLGLLFFLLLISGSLTLKRSAREQAQQSPNLAQMATYEVEVKHEQEEPQSS